MFDPDLLHFTEIAFQEDPQEFLPITLSFVHRFNAEHGNALGVDYPQWGPSGFIKGLSRIRVLGTFDQVTAFLASPKVARLAGLCGAFTAVQAVPAGAELAALSRDNRNDHFKPSYGRRLEKRALARQGAVPAVSAKVPFANAVPVASKSTRQDFLLKLKKTAFQGPREVEFTSYGLCKRGGVPQF